jgi:hypothetical protein
MSLVASGIAEKAGCFAHSDIIGVGGNKLARLIKSRRVNS